VALLSPANAADIRTYAVMPLNEDCGLLEWVSHTNALKSILEKGYSRHGKKVYVSYVGLAELMLDERYAQAIRCNATERLGRDDHCVQKHNLANVSIRLKTPLTAGLPRLSFMNGFSSLGLSRQRGSLAVRLMLERWQSCL